MKRLLPAALTLLFFTLAGCSGTGDRTYKMNTVTNEKTDSGTNPNMSSQAPTDTSTPDAARDTSTTTGYDTSTRP